jgi:hypothetical protein
LKESWRVIIFDMHTIFFESFPDGIELTYTRQKNFITDTIKNLPFSQLLGMVQFILTHERCPPGLWASISNALSFTRAAYQVVDGGLIVPKASEAEGQAVTQAFADLRASEFNGARAHLGGAAELLTAGSWAASVRESISAVEAVVRVLEPSAKEIGPALTKLTGAGHMHKALKSGLSSLYGYTSDEKGIRHSLLEEGDAKVDETDALFMFGACASFVTYMIGKARAGGLLS